MSDIRARISGAARAQGTTALLAKAINLLLAIALARMLHPEDYGLFTIALIATGLANTLSHFGFQTYIIQAKALTAETLNTCYTLNVVLSAVLGGLIAAVGLLWPNPPDLLPQMLALYGVHVFVSGLCYIELALLKRELDFSLSSRIDLTYTMVSMGGRVGFAAAHFGALSFALGDVLGSLLRWILVRRLNRARLRLTIPRRAASREPLIFGLYSTSISLASFVANYTDKALVTANHPIGAVGLYSFGKDTAAMFHNSFVVPQRSVFFAAFARLREDHDAAREMLAVSSRLILSLTLPLNVLMLLEPERLLHAIFGAQWVAAAPLVQVFAIDFLLRSPFSGITGLQLSFGFAAEAARTKWTGASVFVVALLFATALQVGIVGYAIAYVTADLIAAVNNVHVNGRLLAIRWGPYARNLMPPMLIALASTMAWAVVRHFVQDLSLWPSLFVFAGTWLLTYLLFSLRFNRMMFTTLLRMARRKAGGVG